MSDYYYEEDYRDSGFDASLDGEAYYAFNDED